MKRGGDSIAGRISVRSLALALLLTLLLFHLGCAPSLHSLVEQRRLADAICLASNQEEARFVVQSVGAALSPRVHVHAITEEDWAQVADASQARAADAALLTLRAEWAHDRVSVAEVEMKAIVRTASERHTWGEPLATASAYEMRERVARFTGETLPARREHTHTEYISNSSTSILEGLPSIFRPSTRTTIFWAEPSLEECRKAAPHSSAFVSALTRGTTADGYVITEEERRRSSLEVDLLLKDALRGASACTMMIQKTVELSLAEPETRRHVREVFGREMQPLSRLPGRTRVWLDNPNGSWTVDY